MSNELPLLSKRANLPKPYPQDTVSKAYTPHIPPA